ncbi:MAG: CopD family protein [Bacteroidota bacterium]
MDWLFQNIGVVKSLHIIFMVSWFAGLFYMVRLFIYSVEASEKEEPSRTILTEQFEIMQRRLWWIITTPAMVLTLVFGIMLLWVQSQLLKEFYMHLKLGFVFLLLVYHFISQKIYFDLTRGKFHWSSGALRIWNEVATLLLVIIVFIIVLKDSTNWIYASIGFMALALLLLFAIKMYKAVRKKE